MIAAAGLAAAAVLVAVLVQSGGWLVLLDGKVQAGLAVCRIPPLLAAASWLTQIGTGAAGAAVLLAATGLLWSSGRGAATWPLWLAFLGAEATTWSAKFVTARPRPPVLDGLLVASPSFPSAHATVAVAVYGALALLIAEAAPRARPEILAAGAALVLAIMLTRLVLSVHYLSDVIAGALVGGAWLALAWRLRT